MNYKVMLLPGDGVGPEIMEVGTKVLNLAAEKFELNVNVDTDLIGGASFEELGTPLSDRALAKCFESDAILLGAVGGYKWEKLDRQLRPETALLRLRKELGLNINLRPAKIFSGFENSSSLKNEIVADTDFVVVRELGSGIYYGKPRGEDNNCAYNTMFYSRNEIEKVVNRAFKIAQNRNKKLLSVDKANVLEVSQLWRNVAEETAKNYPEVELSNMYVDNAAMQIVQNPKQFDVIVTGNMFGDILSDIAGSITGSLGMLPSASVGNRYALYEPVHGSAPDIAGKGIANPVAMVLSVAMMFENSFNLPQASAAISKAVEETLNQGYRTKDIFTGKEKLVSTSEMGRLICENFQEVFESQLNEKVER